MKRGGLILLVCLAASALEAVLPHLLHLESIRADLLLSVVLYLALHGEVVEGAALSLAAGYLSDLTSAAPACLYSSLAVFTFIVVRVFGSAFKESMPQAALLAFAASLIHSTLAAILFTFVAPDSEGVVLPFPQLLWAAVGTALAAPLVFRVLRGIDVRLSEAAVGGLR